MKCNRPVNSYSRALLILSYCVQVPYWAMNVNQRCLPASVYLTKSYPYLTSYHQHLTLSITRATDVSYSVCIQRRVAVGKPKHSIALYRKPLSTLSYAPAKSRPMTAARGGIAPGVLVSTEICNNKFRSPVRLSVI